MADPDVVTKTQFAILSGVSASRVSQWIAAKKIDGAAIVGEGPRACIRLSVARQQLRRRLDARQLAANGAGTRLDGPSPAGPQSTLEIASSSQAAPGDDVDMRIKLLRLEQLERGNRRAQIEELVRLEQLVIANNVRAAFGRIGSELVQTFEIWATDLALGFAEEFNLSAHDVRHFMGSKIGDLRSNAAAKFRAAAAAMPTKIDFDLDTLTNDSSTNTTSKEQAQNPEEAIS